MKNQKINVAKYTEFTELVDIKRLNFIADSIQEHCSPGARILDVGCGNGNIARGIGSLGYEVVGIDFSEDAIRYAFTHVGFALLATTLVLGLGYAWLANSAIQITVNTAIVTTMTIALALLVDLFLLPALFLLLDKRKMSV